MTITHNEILRELQRTDTLKTLEWFFQNGVYEYENLYQWLIDVKGIKTKESLLEYTDKLTCIE